MKKIYKSFLIVLVMTILAKLASFVSEVIIASLLGTSAKADAYSMIIGIHQVIYPMLSVGIWSVFLPMYKKKITKLQGEDVDTFLNKVLTLFLVISICLTIFVIIFAKQIIMLVANGFSMELKEQCTILLRIYSPYFVFVIISSIYAAVLQSHDKFLGSQIREVVTYVPTIILGSIAYKLYDVKGLVILLVLGSILRLLVLIPFLNKDYKFKLKFDFKDKDIGSLLKSMPSVLVTSGIEQVNTLVDKVMASNLAVGAVSSLSYGNKLINVFNGLFTSAISTTIYPTMSKLVAEDKKDELKKLLTKIINIIGIVVLPLSILMILLRKEIVTIVFGRGNFDAESINSTSTVFLGYLIGMLYIGIKPILNNVYYSIGNTTKIMRVSIITIVVNIILNIILVKYFGIIGLGIATSIASIIYYFLLVVGLYKMKYINIKDNLINLAQLYFISLVPFFVVGLILNKSNFSNILLRIIIGGLVYMVIYFSLLTITNKEEEKELIKILSSKFNFKKGK